MDVQDVVEINQLLSLYGHVVDAAKFTPVDSEPQERLRDVFTDDAVFDATRVGSEYFKGLSEIRAMFARQPPAHPRSHQTTNVYVHEDGGVVRVHSKWHVLGAHGKVVVGDYHDVVVREHGGWRIAERVATM